MKRNHAFAQKNQKGFTVLEIILIIALLVMIGAVAYLIYSRNKITTPADHNNSEASQSEDTTSNRDPSIPPDIFNVELGETASDYGSQITITDTKFEDAEHAGITASEGAQSESSHQNDTSRNTAPATKKQYLVVDYTIENKSINTNTYDPGYFSLETPDKVILDAIALRTENDEWGQITIAPGGSFSARVAFDLDKTQKAGSTIVWQGPDWVWEGQDIRISLQ